MTEIEKKFTNCQNIYFCYVDNIKDENIELMRKVTSEKFKLKEIDEFLIEDKDASHLKEFLESTMTSDRNDL
uniref:Uncharacterized protein n=1 Tax=Panagrolaimus sp. ES5 TaxID=591445 RepID=A0AC34GAR7_9BILA